MSQQPLTGDDARRIIGGHAMAIIDCMDDAYLEQIRAFGIAAGNVLVVLQERGIPQPEAVGFVAACATEAALCAWGEA